MKYTLSFLLLLLLSVNIYSQEKTKPYQQLIMSNFLNPNDTLEKFRGLLTAQGDTSKELINIDTISTAGTFNYLPALNDTIVLGTVRFKYIALQINTAKKVAVVGFSKAYSRWNKNNTRELMEDDYQTIVTYLDSTLKVPSTPYSKQSKMYKKDASTAVPHLTRGFTWKTDKVSYRIYISQPVSTNNITTTLGTISVNAWRTN
jgi:hypothetical protein